MEQYHEEEKVKWRSKRRYPCKRNKSQHEWNKPTFLHKPSVRYIYDTGNGILSSSFHEKDYKFLHSEVSSIIEIRCIHCGKKEQIFTTNKIK